MAGFLKLIFIIFLASGAASAVMASDGKEAREKHQVTQTLQIKVGCKTSSKSGREASELDQLRQQAKAGFVRVIISLAVKEGSSPKDISAINASLQESLKEFSVKDIKTFKYIPHASMQVGSRALEVLITSPYVCGIGPDKQLRLY